MEEQDFDSILGRASIPSLEDETRFFIPEGNFTDSIFTEARIGNYLQSHDQSCDRNANHSLGDIQSGQKKLLSILILCRLDKKKIRSALCHLFRYDISDDDLPFLQDDPLGKDSRLCDRIKRLYVPSVMSVLKNFDDHEIMEFYRLQWSVTAATFLKDSSSGRIPHYSMHQKMILPFIACSSSGNISKYRSFSDTEGFYTIRIAAGHHNLPGADSFIPSLPLKLKVYESIDKLKYEKDTQFASALCLREQPHIETILATYEQNDRYYSLAPWATYNLEQFWSHKLHPEWNVDSYRWTLKQMLGLSAAVDAIEKELPKLGLVNYRGLSRNCILWREEQGGIDSRLKISASDLYGRQSPRNSSPEAGPLGSTTGTQRYHAPKSIPIRKGSDWNRENTWQLGCLMFDLVVWLVEGHEGIKAFDSLEMQRTDSNFAHDTYFAISLMMHATRSHKFRHSMSRHIKRLRRSQRCSNALQRVLDLVETKMLVIDYNSRAKTLEIHEELQKIWSEPDEYIIGLKTFYQAENSGVLQDLAMTPLVGEEAIKLDVVSSDSGYGSMHLSLPPASINDLGPGPTNNSSELSLKDDAPSAVQDDKLSIISDDFDIQSQAPSRRTHERMLAERHIAELLSQHEDLNLLFSIAFTQMDENHFVNNISKLLKTFYLGLTKSADTNLEHATAEILRSRVTRTEIARHIFQRSNTDNTELDIQHLDDSEHEHRRLYLDNWIQNNPGFALPLEPEVIFDEIELKDHDTESEEEEEENNRNDNNPNITGIERFFLQEHSVRSLITNICLFLLPGSLGSLNRVLLTVPSDHVWFSSVQDISISNRIKGFVEDYTEETWNWWPMQARKRRLTKDQWRVIWKCANSYQKVLPLLRNRQQGFHLCKNRPRSSRWATLARLISKHTGGSSPETPTASQGVNNLPMQPQKIHLRPSRGNTQQSSQMPHASTGTALRNQQGVHVTIGGLQEENLHILFGVKGSRRTLELEQIPIKETSDDNGLFESISRAYKRHRGYLRYWFSVWQLAYCDFVKFKKFQANRIIYHSTSLPEESLYEYDPRPPKAENPPILPHEFEIAFSACSSDCRFSALHDCIWLPRDRSAIERIPKRKGSIAINTNDPEFAWGIRAQHTISFLRVLIYHVLMFAGTFAFWGFWLRYHPNDLQNAAVPLTALAMLLSLFWSSAGMLKPFKDVNKL